MATFKGRDIAIVDEVWNDHSKVNIRSLEDGTLSVVNKSEVTVYDPKDIPTSKKDSTYDYRYPSKDEEEVYLKLKALKAKAVQDQKLKDERQAPRKQEVVKQSTPVKSGNIVPALAPGEYAKLRAAKR